MHKLMTDSPNYLAHNINKLLSAHHMNANELAKILDLPYNTINRLLNGVTSDPRISTVQQISEYFGVTIDYLFGNASDITLNSTSILVLKWEELQQTHFLENSHKDITRRYINGNTIENELIDNNFFALESTKSMQKRFPIGTTFIIKTNETPIDGDLAIIRFKADNIISVREIVIDSPEWQLMPIVPGSSNIIFEDKAHDIMGIIILTLIQTRSS